MLGKTESGRRRGRQRMRWLDGMTGLMDMNFSKLQETVKEGKPDVLQSLGLQRVRHNLVTEQQIVNNYTSTIEKKYMDTKGERQGVGGTGRLGLTHKH